MAPSKGDNGKEIDMEKDLIWVEKQFAEKYKELESEKADRDIKNKVLEEYMESVLDASKRDFRANLDALEEDAAMFSGLMISVKKRFEDAKDEALNASYTMWENYEKEKDDIVKKINSIKNELIPLQENINDINESLSKINTYNLDKVADAVSKMEHMYNSNQKMFKFLVDNFSNT